LRNGCATPAKGEFGLGHPIGATTVADMKLDEITPAASPSGVAIARAGHEQASAIRDF
jgi:hypothetical protein